MNGWTERRPAARWAAVAAFAATLCAVSWSLLGHRQLGDLQGLSDVWLRVAVDSAELGDLAISGEATMFKPPGYPAFLRTVLAVAHSVPPLTSALRVATEGDAQLQSVGGPIYWAQGLTLALAAAALCLWLSGFLPIPLALAAAVCFGVNPYVLTYVGTPHYAIPYMALLVVCCWATERALAAQPGLRLELVGAGLLWALATLMRPVTLLLAPFLLAAFLWRHWPRARAAVGGAAVVLGVMFLALSPWTARNYVLSGRVVPVNAQAWLSIWPAAVRSSEPDPNRYRWKEIRRPFRRLLKREALGTERTDPYSVADNLRIEDATRRAVLANLRRSPGVYLGNVVESFYSYHVHVNSILIGLYAYIQKPGVRLKSWYWPGQSQVDFASPVADVFAVFLGGLSLLALGGAVWSLRSAGPPLLGTLSVHLCLALAHSITWMDLMYYFTKWPFVVVFAFAFLHWALRSRTVGVAGRRWRLDVVVGWSIALFSVALTVALLL